MSIPFSMISNLSGIASRNSLFRQVRLSYFIVFSWRITVDNMASGGLRSLFLLTEEKV